MPLRPFFGPLSGPPVMRDARLLAWLLAHPDQSGALLPGQWRAVLAMAEAEGVSADLAEQLADTPCPDEIMSALKTGVRADVPQLTGPQICTLAERLFVALDLDGGLKALWHIDRAVRRLSLATDFWPDLLAESRARGVTLAVSRALRLCHHLFQTPVDPYLAWQGRWRDIFFVGRLLARGGQGEERAIWLRRAFYIARRWRQKRRAVR